MINRSRYVELTQIASEVVDFVLARGVKLDEGCFIQEIAGKMWDLELIPSRGVPRIPPPSEPAPPERERR